MIAQYNTDTTTMYFLFDCSESHCSEPKTMAMGERATKPEIIPIGQKSCGAPDRAYKYRANFTLFLRPCPGSRQQLELERQRHLFQRYVLSIKKV